jgi:hypothetical protein
LDAGDTWGRALYLALLGDTSQALSLKIRVGALAPRRPITNYPNAWDLFALGFARLGNCDIATCLNEAMARSIKVMSYLLIGQIGLFVPHYCKTDT